MKLTEEQYKRVLEADLKDINYAAIEQFLKEVEQFEKEHKGIKTYELS